MVAEYEHDGWLFWERSSSGSWQEVQFLEELALLWHQEEQGESVPWLQCLESSRAQRDANGRHDCSFVAVKSSNGDVFLSSHPPLTCALHLTNTRKLGKNSIKTKNCQIVLWRLKIERKKNQPVQSCFGLCSLYVLHPSTAITFWKNFGKSNKLHFFVEVFQSEQNQITDHLNPQCPTHTPPLLHALVLSRSFERLMCDYNWPTIYVATLPMHAPWQCRLVADHQTWRLLLFSVACKYATHPVTPHHTK